MNCTVIVTYTVIAPKRKVSVWRLLAPSIVFSLSLALLVISLLQFLVMS